jgi:hypothetical protein
VGCIAICQIRTTVRKSGGLPPKYIMCSPTSILPHILPSSHPHTPYTPLKAMSDQTSGSQPQEITQLFLNFGIPVCNDPNCLFDPNTPLCESNILDLPPQLVTVEVGSLLPIILGYVSHSTGVLSSLTLRVQQTALAGNSRQFPLDSVGSFNHPD